MILETKWLYLRKMRQEDFDVLCKIYQAPEVGLWSLDVHQRLCYGARNRM